MPSASLYWIASYQLLYHLLDDWISIWYYTNSHNGWTTAFDKNKPTAVLMHPPFLDSTWMRFQASDPLIQDHYNILAYDMRCSGCTKNQPSGRHDLWTDTADLAMLLQVRTLETDFMQDTAAQHNRI